jgi:hypothetical protein
MIGGLHIHIANKKMKHLVIALSERVRGQGGEMFEVI